MDSKQIKQINSELAASAQQDVRDKALIKLQKLLIQEGKWFNEEDKELKMIWEGLFFMFWHSDKAQYQRDVAIKVTKLFALLDKQGKEKQKKWFESFIYIFNMHWDKVDNYRIDKYLLFLRHQFNEVFSFLKQLSYDQEDLKWYNEQVSKLFLEEFVTSKGIPLQLCDVFLEELNIVDKEISTETLSFLLEPFLFSLAKSRNRILVNRIKERIFVPLLENNITFTFEDEDEEAEIQKLEREEEQKRKEGVWIDGGKYSKRRQKEIEKIVNRKYYFPNFNILLFAQEYLLKFASDPESREENRNDLYDLYDKAQNLEPKPEKPELTFTQRMLVNRAQTFITKKMQKRMKFSQQKKNKKMLDKVGTLISTQIFGSGGLDTNIFEQIRQKRNYIEQLNQQFVDENKPVLNNISTEEKNNATNSINNNFNNGNHKDVEEQKVQKLEQVKDETLNIEIGLKKKKNNKRKKRSQDLNHNNGELNGDKKKVKFDLDHCQTREFFMHGKVATKKVDDSSSRISPSKGVIKQMNANLLKKSQNERL